MSMPKGLRPDDWKELQVMYWGGQRWCSYKKRRIGVPIEEFEQHLLDLGADIYTDRLLNEVLRFSINGTYGVVYTSGAGSLLAHEIAEKYLGVEA